MQTIEHLKHIASRVSHMNCDECRADAERRHLQPIWPGYRYVSEYLAYIRPRLPLAWAGVSESRNWHQDFRRALDRRITLKGGAEQGRKRVDAYLARLRQFPAGTDGAYLRRFAARGASTLL